MSNKFNGLCWWVRDVRCEQALRIYPNFPEAWAEKSRALTALGRHQEALEAHERELQLRADQNQV